MEPTPTQVIRRAISRADLATIAAMQFGDMVKAVVDVARGVEDEALRERIRSVVATLVSDA